MASVPDFVRPYPGGWQDFSEGETPITAEILNETYDEWLAAVSGWINGAEPRIERIPDELIELTGDVLITDPSNGQVLKYNATTHMWYNGTDETGSTVTFSQIQASGTKIATITIDGTSYDIYAPNGGGGGGDTVTWTQIQSTGTKIATITINGTSTDVYIPALPTKTSDLTNDSNFVSDASYVHTDNNYTTTEKNKLADLNEVVANPQSGTSAGDLSSISIGGTKYDIPSGGGGGTTVIANPSGSATANLDKLQVGNDIYAIPSGGGDIYNLVPRLTANDSSPVGTASADGTLSSSFQPWHAFATEDSFDASQNGGYWASGSNGGYLQFAFANSVTIKKLEFGVYDASTFTIYYSDDGTNYTQGDAISATPDKTGYICRKKEYLLTGPITCRYIRLVATGSQNIGAVHFYGDSGTSGETTVIANPSGEATVELEKLQVGSTIYSIPEGGSGGSSDYIDVVGKLTAGNTSITLSSPKIKTSSCVFPWTSVFGLAPTNMVVQNGSVTLTFPAQQSDVDVMVRVTKLNTGHVYDIDLSTLQLNKSWLYYDANKSSVNDTGDGLQLSGDDADNSWTTSATIGINIANMIGTVPSGLTALKLHFKTFEMDGYTGVRFMNINTLYTGQAGGSDAILRTNGFYQFENNNSSIDEDDYELTVPCEASDLTNTYLYIMFFDGMIAGNTSGYSNSLNGSYNIIIDGIDFVTGGNS